MGILKSLFTGVFGVVFCVCFFERVGFVSFGVKLCLFILGFCFFVGFLFYFRKVGILSRIVIIIHNELISTLSSLIFNITQYINIVVSVS